MRLKKTQGAGIIDPERPVILGIDQSWTGFGITAVQGAAYLSDLYVISGRGVDGIHAVINLLKDEINWNIVENVAIEGYSMGSKTRAHMAGELGAAVRMGCFLGGQLFTAKYPLVIPPTQLKKYATGKGNASKSEILLGVYKHFGVEFTDDNMADSYALAQIAAGSESNKAQREVLAAAVREREIHER